LLEEEVFQQQPLIWKRPVLGHVAVRFLQPPKHLGLRGAIVRLPLPFAVLETERDCRFPSVIASLPDRALAVSPPFHGFSPFIFASILASSSLSLPNESSSAVGISSRAVMPRGR
jgi:hypothetical protein